MIPYVEITVPFDLAEYAEGRASKVVRRLENVGDPLRHGKRENEQVAVPHIQGIVEMQEGRTFCIEP